MATRALTFSLGGLSKASGLPHLKLGWIAVGGPPPLARDALSRLELINDTYLSAAGPVQRALPQLLDLGAGVRTAIQHRVARNRSRLLGALHAGTPCTCLNAEGGWTAILRVPDLAGDGASDEEWALRLLVEDGVLVHPGYLFDMPVGGLSGDEPAPGARHVRARHRCDRRALSRFCTIMRRCSSCRLMRWSSPRLPAPTRVVRRRIRSLTR